MNCGETIPNFFEIVTYKKSINKINYKHYFIYILGSLAVVIEWGGEYEVSVTLLPMLYGQLQYGIF